jgi:hypothetical protein
MTFPSKRAKVLDDWVKSYLVWTHPTSPPEIFHKWSALSAVAGALRRRVYFDYGHFHLYPNMYNVLIGPPGSMKSTAMRIGNALLSKVPNVKFSVDSITRERLIQDISQANQEGASAMTVYCSEFSSFFSSSGPEMAVFLTDIYESPVKWAHSSKSGGQNTLNAPCLNLHACTTPETMAKQLPIHVVGLGLTSRTNFIHAELARDRPYRTKKTPTDGEMEGYLINDLQVISTYSGEFDFDSEADSMYDKWYRGFQKNPKAATNDERLRPWFSRKHTHVIKLCMALAASRLEAPVMTKQDLATAFELCEEIEAVMGRAFSGFGAATTAQPMEKIIELLYYATPLQADGAPALVAYSQLLDALKRDIRRDEFDECLDTLLATGSIVKIIDGKGQPFYTVSQSFRED